MSATARPFWIILAVAGVWGLADVVWVVTGTPAPVVAYAAALTRRVEDAQPPGRDGWALFTEASRLAQAIDDQLRARQLAEAGESMTWAPRPDYGRIRLAPLDREKLAWELEALAELEASGAVAVLADAASCPRVVRPMPGDTLLIHQHLPELASFRLLAKMRAGAMRLAAAAGRHDEHLAAFEQTLAIGRAAGSQGVIIERLVGTAVVSLALEELRMELLETDFPATHCRALRTAMDRQLRWPPPSLMVEGERAMCLDLVQSFYTDDGHGSGRLDSSAEFIGLGASFAGPAGAFQFQADRRAVTGKLDELFDGMIATADMPPPERATRGFDVVAFSAGLGTEFTLVRNIVPALDKVMTGEDNFWTFVAGTRLLLVLAEHRAVHGDWPATLDALDPDLMSAVPLDPACEMPFIYRPGPAAMPIICYSVGVDGKDDSADVDGTDPETMPFSYSVHLGDVLIITPRATWEEIP